MRYWKLLLTEGAQERFDPPVYRPLEAFARHLLVCAAWPLPVEAQPAVAPGDRGLVVLGAPARIVLAQVRFGGGVRPLSSPELARLDLDAYYGLPLADVEVLVPAPEVTRISGLHERYERRPVKPISRALFEQALNESRGGRPWRPPGLRLEHAPEAFLTVENAGIEGTSGTRAPWPTVDAVGRVRFDLLAVRAMEPERAEVAELWFSEGTVDADVRWSEGDVLAWSREVGVSDASGPAIEAALLAHESAAGTAEPADFGDAVSRDFEDDGP